MLCDEGVFAANDFALKVCRQARMVFGQTCRLISLPRSSRQWAVQYAPLMRR
jgi:hypothetical protein